MLPSKEVQSQRSNQGRWDRNRKASVLQTWFVVHRASPPAFGRQGRIWLAWLQEQALSAQILYLGVALSFPSSPRHLSPWAAGMGPCVSATRNPKNWTNLQALRNRCHKAKPSCIYLQRTPTLGLAFWSPNKVNGPSSVQVLSSLQEHRTKPTFRFLVFFHSSFIYTPKVSSFWSSLRVRKYKEISGCF